MKKTNKYILVFVLLVFAGAVSVTFVKGDQAASLLSDPVSWILALMAFFLIISMIAIFNALNSIKYHVLKKEGRLDEITEAEEDMAAEESFLGRLWQRIQDAKPVEREAEIELDHEYDGIRELDNNLPPWWLWGFYISIAFAVVYLVRYHVIRTAPLSAEEFQQQMAEAEVQKAEYLKNAANLVDETNVTMLTDEALIREGATIFSQNCAVCHAQDGGGGVGPNLTDEYWIHGGSIKDIFSTVKYGVPAKGMIPWKDQLNPSQMQKVSSFVLSLQGTSPANPKDPQGEIYAQNTTEQEQENP